MKPPETTPSTPKAPPAKPPKGTSAKCPPAHCGEDSGVSGKARHSGGGAADEPEKSPAPEELAAFPALPEKNGHRVTLTRRDAIVFEKLLKDVVAAFFPFKGHSILFPRRGEERDADWIAGEKKLLLPLPDLTGGTLCVFVARGVQAPSIAALLPRWPALAGLIAANLLLYKRSLCDPVTGLISRHYLLQRMEREIETLRDPMRPSPLAQIPRQPSGTPSGPAKADPPQPPQAASYTGEGLLAAGGELPRRSSLGILVVRLAALRDVVREFGYQFADELMVALADALTALCPEQALAARTGDSEFAVHLPAATPKACRTLAAEIVNALRAVFVVHSLRRERVGIAPSVGFTLYPQDMAGDLFVRPAAEQARLVLRKARLAAALAGEDTFLFPGQQGAESVMGFGRILAEGGRVLEVLPLSRVVVSLGSSMHAREGQRFSVWSVQYPAHSAGGRREALAPLYKGELALMEVQENTSQAEVIHLGDPAWTMEPGDRLILLPEEQGSPARGQEGAHSLPPEDPATGLLRHGEFLARWAIERDRCDTFTLALVRLAPPAREPLEPEDNSGEEGTPHPARFMGEAVQLCREELGAELLSVSLAGRYGLNSLIFFHPNLDAQEAFTRYEALARTLEDRLQLNAAVGIAAHPCLEFRKADALENCRKALEYAMLLPKPHVGALDSLALNISADKRFSQGDTFGAIREYQLALLMDEANGMAWNSLGICFAGLGRHAEAERHFSRALACNPDDVMSLYNLGYIHQSQGQEADARKRYGECLARDPDHLFALIRLGQLAENAGNPLEARGLYEKAALLPDGEGLTCRHFARLCIAEGKPEEAREYLHEALLHDHQDALAMQLLARLYLDAGEDPDMAASLARSCVSLRPGLKSGWLELARALDAMGRDKEAREARLKAGEV